MKEEILKKSKIKEIFKKRGFRISNKTIKKFSELVSDKIKFFIEKTTRNARISGRKTIRKEDFDF